jgi:hypothetical protein
MVSSAQSSCGSTPAMTGAQTPSATPVAARVHASHGPAQGRSQQIPSPQNRDAQSSSPLQRRAGAASGDAPSAPAPGPAGPIMRRQPPGATSSVSMTRAARMLIHTIGRHMRGESTAFRNS